MRKSLDESQKFYIESNYKNISVEEIAAGMTGIGVKTVEKYIKELEEEEKEKETEFTGLKPDDLMGRRLKPNGEPDRSQGFIVMTKAASELSDENFSKRNKVSNKYKDAIHRIR